MRDSTAARVIALLLALLQVTPSRAQDTRAQDGIATGSVTKLPVPRYVSLKSDRVNLREGPSKDHRTAWVYQRAGLPVEIVAEFETWRRVRDAEGAEGWVLHSLLSGRRTALIAPGNKAETLPLQAKPGARGDVVAHLQPGVLASVKACEGGWCRVHGQGVDGKRFDGHIAQARLWGVYPDETVD